MDIRWFFWQRCFGVFDSEAQLDSLRSDYEAKKKQMVEVFEEIDDEYDSNPLMVEKIDVKFWLKFQTPETQLRDIVEKDAVRTFQDQDLFLEDRTQNWLKNILLTWGMQNMKLGYRQGKKIVNKFLKEWTILRVCW